MMVVKLLAAGLIAALLAGGAVYFGASTVSTQRAPITSSDSGLSDFIGRVLRRDYPSENRVISVEEVVKASEGGSVPVEPASDTELADIQAASEAGLDGASDTTESLYPDTIRPESTGPITIDRPTREAPDGPRRLITPIDVLIAQADRISIPDSRDDAYLNILDYALSQDRISVTTELIDKLSTNELRDIARQRLGVAHAENGRIEEAFAVIETLEIEEWSDPIRLEIIRAAASVR